MHLSERNKILIAGIIGALVLIVSFDLLMADFSAKEQALNMQFPGREQDGVPGGFYLALMGIALLASAGFVCGICYTVLAMASGLKVIILQSAASGAAAGLLIFLATCAMIVVNTFSSGPAESAVAMFTGAFNMAPLFIAVSFLLAAFGALGGIVAKLGVMGANKMRNSGA